MACERHGCNDYGKFATPDSPWPAPSPEVARSDSFLDPNSPTHGLHLQNGSRPCLVEWQAIRDAGIDPVAIRPIKSKKKESGARAWSSFLQSE